MRNALLIVSVLLVAIMSTACINNFAVQELNNKAAEYMAKGDYAAAIGRLEASLDIEPGIFETNYNLGVASISAEDYEKAVGALTKAVSIKSDVSDAYFSLAVVYLISTLESSTMLKPENASMIENILSFVKKYL